MNSVPPQDNGLPVQSTSPEEDPTLLAIEALEAREVDSKPRPPTITVRPDVAPRAVVVPIVPPVQPSTPKPAPLPKKRGTNSEEMDQEIALAPSPKRFQFFANQKPPRKPFVIVGSLLIIIGVAVGAYFAIA